ncbi:hypothetical protein PT974_07170 [Cladobotryum mycophilum]|uniref:Uncharacterized protein n=1 Tax=Cladobotryum mycophilum TaxID=491253 RepID=A0ABR0SNI5_9HYPO
MWPEMGRDFGTLCHDLLKEACHKYISYNTFRIVTFDASLSMNSPENAEALEEKVLKEFPLLQYATQHVLYHANATAGIVQQYDFLRGLDLKLWVKMWNIFHPSEIRHYTDNASLVYICAENNWAELIRTLLGQNETTCPQGERFRYPLFAAIANNSVEAAEALFHGSANVQADLPKIKYGEAFEFRDDETPLHWAARSGYTSLLRHFLLTGGLM